MAESEYTLERAEKDIERYLSGRLTYIMDTVAGDLESRRKEEASSVLRAASPLADAASAMDMMPGERVLSQLHIMGEWNSKTTTDYVLQVSGNVAADPQYQAIKDFWRRAYISENGQASYDRLCAELGADAASLYVGDRVDEHVIDTLARQRVPATSIGYVIDKGIRLSFLQLAQDGTDRKIATKVDVMYGPSTAEKTAARVTGAVIDTVPFLNPASATVASAAATVTAFSTLDFAIDRFSANHREKGVTLSSFLSGYMSEKDADYLSTLREAAEKDQQTKELAVQDADTLRSDHSFQFIPWPEQSPDRTYAAYVADPSLSHLPFDKKARVEDTFSRYQAPDARVSLSSAPAAQEAVRQSAVPVIDDIPSGNRRDPWSATMEHAATTGQLNDLGQGMLNSLGSGLSGSAIATLPETILGALSGRGMAGCLKDNILPIACLLMAVGMKRNPLLKLMLLLYGGGTLLSGAGRDTGSVPASLQDTRVEQPASVYKQYEDQPLNGRIGKDVTISGGAMAATIDGRLYHIPLTPAMLDAYEKGAVPLNTMANAVLQRMDQLREQAEQRFAEASVSVTPERQVTIR